MIANRGKASCKQRSGKTRFTTLPTKIKISPEILGQSPPGWSPSTQEDPEKPSPAWGCGSRPQSPHSGIFNPRGTQGPKEEASLLPCLPTGLADVGSLSPHQLQAAKEKKNKGQKTKRKPLLNVDHSNLEGSSLSEDATKRGRDRGSKVDKR